MFIVYSNEESVFVTTSVQEEEFIKQDISEGWDRDFSDTEKWDRVERTDTCILVESGGIRVQ